MTVLLENLMTGGDFAAAVNGMAREFRDKHQLPPIHQLGLVIPDVEEAAKALEAEGVSPFFIAKGSPVLWRERGEERSIRGKLGMVHHKGFELELLEPVEGSHFYTQSLDSAGRIVVQHLGFLVKDVDEWADRLTAAGYPLWIRGRLKMGPVKVDFAYMDTVEEVGLVIEFISWRIFRCTFRPRGTVLSSAGRLGKWSRKRCLSV